MRPFTVIECEQRSPEWFAARAGRLTGSVASVIGATLKSGGEPAGRRDLRTKLALERLMGKSLEDDYDNADMKRGRDLEPDALAKYEAVTGELVTRTGFLAYTEAMLGCSLDGHVGDFEIVVELKCPRPANHWKYVQANALPPEHKLQIVHNVLVSGAAGADFCSYCPQFPSSLQFFRVRYVPTQAELDSYLLIATQFLREVDDEHAQMQAAALVAFA